MKKIIIFLSFSLIFCSNIFAKSESGQMSDDELLTKVQQHTFKYFWNYANPHSGLVPERITIGKTPASRVTSGGSGFAVMAVLVGVERGFITREQGVERITKMSDFLLQKASRYKGAFAHWLNGETGVTIPFSPKDNGADLVETSYMIQGLLTARQYFNRDIPAEKQLVDKINTIWNEVEWNYFTFGEKALYWHCNNQLQKKEDHALKITGWNECMITYLLGIASPTHPIDVELWKTGWSSYKNKNQTYYGITLPVGTGNVNAKGGPLFFTHYSFLGFDPRNLKDTYNNINYFRQNEAQTIINRAYCEENPLKYVGYGKDKAWGLTACDGHDGYSAFSPANDKGTVAPTAAISAMPYTPEESMAAIRYYYYTLQPSVWNDQCGFVDAFNQTHNWVDNQYLSIDQGPIICMIENYRSGLLWKYFMSAPEIQQALQRIGFVYDDYPAKTTSIYTLTESKNKLFVTSDNNGSIIHLNITEPADTNISIYTGSGQKVKSVYAGKLSPGGYDFISTVNDKGIYIVQASVSDEILSKKFIR